MNNRLTTDPRWDGGGLTTDDTRRQSAQKGAVRRPEPRAQPRVRQFSELCECAVLASQQDHHQQLRVSSVIWRHAAQDHHATAGTCCLGTAAQDQPGFPVWPVVENGLEEIEIRPCWQRVEETLPDCSDPFTHPSRPQERALRGPPSWGDRPACHGSRVGRAGSPRATLPSLRRHPPPS